MGKVFFALAALVAVWLLPSSAVAQAREADEADRKAAPSVPIEDDPEISGKLLIVAPGRLAAGPVKPAGFDWEMDEDGWGIREHRFYIVPKDVEQPDIAWEPGDRPDPVWPGESLKRSHAFADSYAFPELVPTVSGWYQVAAGGAGDDRGSIFSQKVGVDLYLLRLGLTLYDQLDGQRADAQLLTADLRIPFAIGDTLYLGFLPGVTVDASRLLGTGRSNVRFQSALGYGVQEASFEVRAGVTQGARPAGVLLTNPTLRVEDPAVTLGLLGAVRPARSLELRAEVASELGVDGGSDLLSLMPGLAVYPLSDERVEIGAAAVVESRSADLGLEDPAMGLLLRMGLNVL